MSHPNEPAAAQTDQPLSANPVVPTPPAQDTVPQPARASIAGHMPPREPLPGAHAAARLPAFPIPAVSSDAKPPRVYGSKPPRAVGFRAGRLISSAVSVIALSTFGIGYFTSHPAQRNNKSQISQAGQLSPVDLKIGDCFNSPSGTSKISSIQAIPCTQPHDSQVFAEPAIAEASYPGSTVLLSEADTDCGDTKRQSVISQSQPVGMDLENLVPQDEVTFEKQDYIICAIKSPTQILTRSYVNAPGTVR